MQAAAETARLKSHLATLEQEFAATATKVQTDTAAVLKALNGSQHQLHQAMHREEEGRQLLQGQIRDRETHLTYLLGLQQRFIFPSAGP